MIQTVYFMRFSTGTNSVVALSLMMAIMGWGCTAIERIPKSPAPSQRLSFSFRVVACAAQSDVNDLVTLSLQDRDRLVQLLADDGPDAIQAQTELYVWKSIREGVSGLHHSCVTGMHGDSTYLLLLNEPSHMMTSRDGDWGVKRAHEAMDWDNRLALSLTLDANGTEKFKALTEANIGRPVAIVIDGEVLLAPMIHAPITSGQLIVSGDFKREELRKIAAGIM